MKRYFLRLPDPQLARGSDDRLSFRAVSAEAFAEELQAALREDTLFQRWRAMQDDPDAIEASLGTTDPLSTVQGSVSHLAIDLIVSTELPAQLLMQRLRWLAGSHWALHDVTDA